LWAVGELFLRFFFLLDGGERIRMSRLYQLAL
jgi:hypothetical protein